MTIYKMSEAKRRIGDPDEKFKTTLESHLEEKRKMKRKANLEQGKPEEDLGDMEERKVGNRPTFYAIGHGEVSDKSDTEDV